MITLARMRRRHGQGARTVDVEIVLCENLGALVNRLSGPVEDTPKHVLRHRELHTAASEFDMRRPDVHSGRAFEDLDDGLLSLHFQDLAAAFRAIR